MKKKKKVGWGGVGHGNEEICPVIFFSSQYVSLYSSHSDQEWPMHARCLALNEEMPAACQGMRSDVCSGKLAVMGFG